MAAIQGPPPRYPQPRDRTLLRRRASPRWRARAIPRRRYAAWLKGRAGAPGSGGAVARLGAGPGLGRLGLAVLGRGRGGEVLEQVLGRVGDLRDGLVEGSLVGGTGLGAATDLADVLEGCGADLVGGGGGLEVVQLADVSAHTVRLRRGGRVCRTSCGRATAWTRPKVSWV